MVKYCISKYPMGSFPRQQSPGRYIDGFLYDNLKIMAKRIVDDMTFLVFVFSSTLEVGTGKSVFTQQMAEAVTELVNEYHGDKIESPITLTAENIVFKPEDLIERSFKVPKYSSVILDEWEDAHYWSKLGLTLRTFFRKCRQLNLFIWCIIPNFFECPKGYAISRSVCAIDVHFDGEFERGFFKFYNFTRKKELYVKGKKTHNYEVVRPNFVGRFANGYAIGEEAYREAKRKDLENWDEDEKKKFDPNTTKREIAIRLRELYPEFSYPKLAEILGVHMNTIGVWIRESNEKEEAVRT